MACLRSLEQTSVDGTWVGRELRTNRTMKFVTLADYQQYTQSLEAQGTYCAPVTPIYNTQTTKGESTQLTGFMEFQPRDAKTQAKYSAMSPAWEGIPSSEAAIARGEYDLDAAATTRKDLRAGRPQDQNQAPVSEWNCSIQ